MFNDKEGSPESQVGRTQEKIAEVIEKAGERSLEESCALWEKTLSIITRENDNGRGRIHHAKTISEVDTKKGGVELDHFAEGGIGFRRLEDGKLLLTSDAHGDFESLSYAIKEFITRKEQGEKVYFGFSGDFCSSDTDKDRLGLAEAVYALKNLYPNDVFIEPGNADKGSIPLFIGLGTDIAKKYLGEDFNQLENKTTEIMDQFYLEQFGKTLAELQKQVDNGTDDEKANAKKILGPQKFLRHTLIGALFLQEARASGAEKLDFKEFNKDFIYAELKDFLKVDKQSPVLERFLARPLISATQDYKSEKQTSIDAEKIKNAFEVYRKLAKAFDNVPVINIINTPNGNITLSHSWPIKLDEIGKLTYDNIDQIYTAWTKYSPGVEGIKQDKLFHDRYGASELSKWFSKNNIVIGQFGHNHGNRLEELPDGELRIETCISAKRAPKEQGPEIMLTQAGFAEVDISKINDPKSAIEFKSAKNN